MRENFSQDIYLNAVGTLPLVKLNEGRLLGSKATVGVGELKLNAPVDADVDDCNITTNSINIICSIVLIYLEKKK